LVLFLTVFANQEAFERKVNRYKGVPVSEVIQADFNKEALNGEVLLKNLFEALSSLVGSLFFVFWFENQVGYRIFCHLEDHRVNQFRGFVIVSAPLK
jgi:hypothetical protein